MIFKITQIAEILQGEVIGNPEAEVSTLSKIEEGEKGSLTFLSNPKYTQYIYSTKATAVIVNDTFEPTEDITATLIKVKDAYQAFTKLLEFYNEYKNQKQGIETPSYISTTAKLGKDVYVGAFAYIGENVVIGDDVKIYPHTYIGDNVVIKNNTTLYAGVKVYMDCKIGEHCKIHAGAVIGADGFGFAPTDDGSYKAIPQIGNVIIEDHVDIGVNTTIDRATMGSTIVEQGVKLDNLVMVAHNVVIGKNTVIAAQSGIAGSTKIGAQNMIGGQVAVSGHLSTGDQVKILGKSGVTKNLKKGGIYNGIPAMEVMKYNRSQIVFRNLPKIIKELKEEISKS